MVALASSSYGAASVSQPLPTTPALTSQPLASSTHNSLTGTTTTASTSNYYPSRSTSASQLALPESHHHCHHTPPLRHSKSQSQNKPKSRSQHPMSHSHTHLDSSGAQPSPRHSPPQIYTHLQHASPPWIRPISLANELTEGIPRSRLLYTITTTSNSDQGGAASPGLATALSSLDLPSSHSYSPRRLPTHSRSHSFDSVFDENAPSKASVMASYALYSGQALAVPLALEDDPHNHDTSECENEGGNEQDDEDEEQTHSRDTQHNHRHHYNSSQYNQNALHHSVEAPPFQKWMKTLQRRAQKRPKPIGEDANVPWQLMDNVDRSTLSHVRGRRFSTCSTTSSVFVGAVKTASISMASTCRSLSRSRSRSQSQSHSRQLDKSHYISPTDRGSRASHVGTRLSTSEDDQPFPAPNSTSLPLNPAALARASQRRRLVEELIKTEEGYISDVRFLMNVYITIFAGLPTLPDALRASINHNLTAIVELHEEILRELYRVVPHLEYSPSTYNTLTDSGGLPNNSNNNKNDLSTTRMKLRPPTSAERPKTTFLPHPHESPEMFAEAQVTEDVAKIFTRKMSRFFIYKEYGANYEIMTKDVAAAHRLMPQWDTYQKGLETLAMSLCSSISHENASRKALTIGDLLVKPIQRICRYPLMFGELLKFTPSEDCPNSHMAVEEALIRVREATTEINKAPTDARMKTTLERTWMLQDRLVFSNQASCILPYIGVVLSCIDLCNLRIEEVDNGRACSPKEELEWKSRLKSRINMNLEWKDAPALNQSSFLDLEIKSLGAIFGKPGTVSHRISIHRASTIGPKSQMCQVILKNTCVLKEAKATNGTSINRSHSLLASNNRIAVLAPTRAERARLETMLSDIWSKEVLPFPGMTARARSEHVVRSTTSSMIRRLSVASITSTFTRRTSSLASISKHSLAGITPGSGTGVMTPGTPPAYFDEPSPIIHGMTRRSTDTTGGYFPPDEQDFRPSTQLPVIEDECGRKPLRRMTLPVSPTKFTIRDIWAAGETGVSNRVPEESEDADEKTGTDDDVLEMRAGRSGKIKHESPTTAQSDERTSIEPADTTFCSTRKVLGEVEEVEEKASVLVVSNIEEEAHPVKLAKPKAGVVELEKEEDGQGEKEKESGAESPSKDNIKRRISKRWSSSSGRHRESMAHGIRSLFR
ncbi:RhoGEF domain-containing protein [Ceratocystis lukuohia]|uniref:RhoGEF domain-containing protein n=1 Tax=Ceratocystis lukuohia TaxID=2019550 RepID=A0ABR4MCE5_9PEZI